MLNNNFVFWHIGDVNELVISAFLICSIRLEPSDRIGDVMVSVLASSAVDSGFEPRSDQTKDYSIGICYFSTKHVSLRGKSKDWLARNQANVSEWGDMSLREMSVS